MRQGGDKLSQTTKTDKVLLKRGYMQHERHDRHERKADMRQGGAKLSQTIETGKLLQKSDHMLRSNVQKNRNKARRRFSEALHWSKVFLLMIYTWRKA